MPDSDVDNNNAVRWVTTRIIRGKGVQRKIQGVGRGGETAAATHT